MYAKKNISGNIIASTAIIHPTVMMGEGCDIGHNVVIEANVILGHGVTIFPNTVIGRKPKTNSAIVRAPEEVRRYVTIGDDVVIGSNVVIYNGCCISEGALIGDGARIRENCFIGGDCIVGSSVGLSSHVIMHRGSRVLDFSSLTADTVVEEGAFIGVGVITQNDNSFNHGGELEPPRFKKGCMVGGNSTILPGVVVGENARVSAGSIVRKSLPPDSLTWSGDSKTRESKVTNDEILDEWANDTITMLEKYYDSRG